LGLTPSILFSTDCVKAPKDVYKSFLSVLSVWVQVQANLEQHVEKLIWDIVRPSEGDGPTNENARPSEGDRTTNENSHNTRLDPLPLNRLCPVCFGTGTGTAFLCLDANFQQNTVKSHGRSIVIQERDLRKCQLFVDEAPKPDAEEVYPLLKKKLISFA
jgi:hypothetical protein